jgi:hypothetical protein
VGLIYTQLRRVGCSGILTSKEEAEPPGKEGYSRGAGLPRDRNSRMKLSKEPRSVQSE